MSLPEGWTRLPNGGYQIDTSNWEPQEFFRPYSQEWYEARSQHLKDTEKFEPLVEAGDEFLNAYSSHDMMNLPPKRWLIKGLVEEEGLGIVFAAPKMGKTLWLTNMLWAWVMGKDWWFDKSFTFENPEQKSERRVLYLMLEGAASYADRLTAWSEAHELDPYDSKLSNFVVVQSGVALNQESYYKTEEGKRVLQLGPVERLSNLIDLLKPQILVVDTLSRAIPGGDENSQADMSALVGTLDTLRDRHGVASIIVHHTARGDDSHPRGSTVLSGAASSSVKLFRREKQLYVQVDEQRNAASDNPPIPFQFVERKGSAFVRAGTAKGKTINYDAYIGQSFVDLVDILGGTPASIQKAVQRAGYTVENKGVGPKKQAEEPEAI